MQYPVLRVLLMGIIAFILVINLIKREAMCHILMTL